MLPRKQSKSNLKAETEAILKAASASQPHESELKTERPSLALPVETLLSDETESVDPIKRPNNGAVTPQPSRMWHGGSWPRGNKANPVTQVARESIAAVGEAASDVVASARARTAQFPSTPVKNPVISLSQTMGSSSRSLPLTATTTKLNVTSNAPCPVQSAAKEGQAPAAAGEIQPGASLQRAGKPALRDEKVDTAPPQVRLCVEHGADAQSKNTSLDESTATNDSARWLNWFSRVESGKADNTSERRNSSKDNHTAETVKDRPQSTILLNPKDTPTSSTQRRNSEPLPACLKAPEQPSLRSWLGLWGSNTTQTTKHASASVTKETSNETNNLQQVQSQSQAPPELESNTASASSPSPELLAAPRTYGWAFWARDQPKTEDGKQHSGSDIGEFVVAGSPSQSEPENAGIDEAKGVPNKFWKGQKPHSLELPEEQKKRHNANLGVKEGVAADGSAVTSKDKAAANVGTTAKRMPENLVLPPFRHTYQTVVRPGFIQQLSRFLRLGSQSESKHVDIAVARPQVKRALAIGVHGYFPAPLIRSVLGQPTGTSIRFANSAASAIQRWTQNQGYSCEIEKVALEGEGKIAERVDLLWKLILNWIDKIRKADFVLIACHSQGVPVAMMLVAKLIAFGCMSSAKVGVCAMAGVNLGPFADYKSRWIGGSAGELFEFAQPYSRVSKDYEAALDVALKFGVRAVFIGSIDDQLVSLESSTFGTISHPYIYRAVFVDGRVHAPDFLTHLVGFALKLRNLGISDHGMIRELSTPLAGSLYGGEGHSRIYEDEAVYYLAVEHALETTSIGNIPLQSYRESPSSPQNPYILPFAMRGLLEEDYVRTELYGEITDLIKRFDDWKPSSKVLKDVKFRLEGVRSKL